MVSNLVVAGSIIATGCASSAPPPVLDRATRFDETLQLPAVDVVGAIPLEQALANRRSGREFTVDELSLATLGQLLGRGRE
ncbi:MAG: hypothetical protein R2710_16650 [Acidimicrobiales bacterium]